MSLEEQARETLRGVLDPHTAMSVWDMGLIHDMTFGDGEISLTFIPTSPFCPLGIELAVKVKEELLKLDGIDKVHVTVQGHLQAEEINKMLAGD